MNIYIDAQCKNIVAMVTTFEKSCHMAATQDDGKISKEEEKTLIQIKKATQKFKSDISRICNR